ncbi:MAG: Holliday junction branch migration protein RuvA [Planctomycetota bacterium]|jgi:Holliday junction DNA helicase RuvA
MYDHLKGRLTEASPSRAVVDCAGVGYLVRIPLTTFEKLPPPGSECLVLTHLHVREDAMELFGFTTEAERSTFRRLISVSGVGPAAAMALMSGNTVGDIVSALRRGDASVLTRAKGIGRKTAERIMLELKGAVAELEALAGVEGARGEAGALDAEHSTVQALVTLGYSEADAVGAAKRAVGELGADAALGELVREALKRVR